MKKLRISAYTHKGGVGRTTICFSLFNRLITVAKKYPEIMLDSGYERVVFIDWDLQHNLIRMAHGHEWDGRSSLKLNISDKIIIEVLAGDMHQFDINDSTPTLIIDDCSPSIELHTQKEFLRSSDKLICPINGKLSMYGITDLKYVLDNVVGWEDKEIWLIPMNIPRSFYWTEKYLRDVLEDPAFANNEKYHNKHIVIMCRREFIFTDHNFSKSEMLGGDVFNQPYVTRSQNVKNMKFLCDSIVFDGKYLAQLDKLWKIPDVK